MEEIFVTIKNETALLSWRQGKIYARGYDLENEKIAITLSGGFGEGIGALLVALDEYAEGGEDLAPLFKDWPRDIARMEESERQGVYSTYDWAYTPNEFFYHYLSFSPNYEWRWDSVTRGVLKKRSVERMLRDSSVEVIVQSIADQYIPLALCATLANHPVDEVRGALVDNYVLSEDLYEILSKDKYARVRSGVAYSTNNVSLLKVLAWDSSESVRDSAFCNHKLPLTLGKQILEKGSKRDRLALARYAHNKQLIKYIFKKGDKEVVAEALKTRLTRIYMRRCAKLE